MLVPEWRQSTNESPGIGYRAEVSITTHYTNFSGPKSPCARLRDAARRYRKRVNTEYRRGINAGLLDDREVVAALGAAAQYNVS